MQKAEVRMQNENPSNKRYFCILTSDLCIRLSLLHSLCAIEQENRIGAFDHPIALFQMPLTKMCPRPLAPGTHQIVIQSCTDQRTCNRNHSHCTLLHYFS